MAKKYVVKLTADERSELEQLVRKGKAAGWKLRRAHALLRCDQGPSGPAWPDERIAQAYGVATRGLECWRKQAVERGPLALLERKPRATSPLTAKLDGGKEARPTALARSRPPKGYARWSLRPLAQRLVELEVAGAISHEAARRAIEKAC